MKVAWGVVVSAMSCAAWLLAGPGCSSDEEEATDSAEDGGGLLLDAGADPGTDDAASPCSDGVQNGDESDVDCGGGDCLPCSDYATCRSGDDCSSGYCRDGRCQTPPTPCFDEEQGEEETDVDCGGPDCPPCEADQSCAVETDCASSVCADGVCQAASCGDGVTNGDETDTDCGGGTCDRCSAEQSCASGSD